MQTARSLRLFIVEDEYLLLTLLQEFIAELGHQVEAATCDFDAALVMAQKANFDVAILDVNLAGTLVWPVADIVKQRGRPIIVTTGYNERALPDDLDCPVLQKPYRVSDLGQALELALSKV